MPDDQVSDEFEIVLIFKDDHGIDPKQVIKTFVVTLVEKVAIVAFDISTLIDKDKVEVV